MKKIITFSILFFVAVACFSQEKGHPLFYINWNLGSPVNNSFVKSFSGNGASVGYTTFIKNNLGVGAELGWGNYNTYASRQTYPQHNGAITTDMYKYIYTVPVTATITKYFKTGNIIYPYAKLGLGTLYSEQNMYYNIYESTNSNWGFLAVPEIGANIKTDRLNNWAFNIGAQYKYATNSTTQYNIKNIQSYNLSLGVSWKIH